MRIRPVLTNTPLITIDNHCEIHPPEREHFIRYNELLTALSRPSSPQIPLMDETFYLMSALPVTASENANQELLTNSLLSPPTALSSEKTYVDMLHSASPQWEQPPQYPVQQQKSPMTQQPQLNSVPSLNEISQPQSLVPQRPQEMPQYLLQQPPYNDNSDEKITYYAPRVQPNTAGERVYISKISPNDRIVQSNVTAGETLNTTSELSAMLNTSNVPQIASVPSYARQQNDDVPLNNATRFPPNYTNNSQNNFNIPPNYPTNPPSYPVNPRNSEMWHVNL
jgi:hypothetical protein